MTGAVIAYGLVVGALVAAAAAALEDALRLAGGGRRWAWLLALAALPALLAIGPRERAETVTDMAATSTSVHTPPATRLAPSARFDLPSVDAAVATLRAAIPTSLDRPLAAAWAVASLLALAWIALVHRRVARARRAWRRATIDATRVSVSSSLGPAVVGVTDPEIVVPDWLLGRPAEEQRLVVAHEREHLEADDQLTLFAGVVAVALVPWNPAAWWMLARLRLAVELDCDRRLLGRGAAPHLYGAMLIDLAGRRSALPLGAPALADTGSHLERRILAMTRPRPRHPLLRGLAFGAVAVAATLAACEARVPTAAEIEKADLGAVQKGLALPDGGTTEYRVDGRAVTEAEAKALPADRIAMMEVEKTQASPTGASRSVVSITTTDSLPFKRADGVRVRADSSVVLKASGRSALKVSDGSPTGFTLIDGVRATPESMKALSPDEIASVEVLKGQAARARFPNEPDAAGGVILITTKKGAK